MSLSLSGRWSPRGCRRQSPWPGRPPPLPPDDLSVQLALLVLLLHADPSRCFLLWQARQQFSADTLRGRDHGTTSRFVWLGEIIGLPGRYGIIRETTAILF